MFIHEKFLFHPVRVPGSSCALSVEAGGDLLHFTVFAFDCPPKVRPGDGLMVVRARTHHKGFSD